MRAHPRGCGADPSSVHGLKLMPGSSPRVRGRRRTSPCEYRAGGLIPAGAGQTLVAHSRARRSRAHPRGCGADAFCRERDACCPGSSPRVRGRLRFIGVRFKGVRAHPRGCGADIRGRLSMRLQSGSSPRVRGRRQLRSKDVALEGLIPAGAGQTSASER